MILFNLAALFVSLAITAVISAYRNHWDAFGFLLCLDFVAGFAFYMTILSL